MSLASARRVARRFGDLVAVDGVDLEVGPGEVVGLLGANGAGKTTLIRMLLGLLRPTSGEVLLFGEPPSRRTRARLGYLPQGLGLWEDLTVGENLAFAAAAFGHPPPELGGDLADVRDELVRDLPLGLRRRAAFALALSHDPELLMLDEPTSGVDPLARAGLWDTIRAAAEGGAGVLVTTHHLEEADHCDRLVMMALGRVAAAGRPVDVVGGATVVEVRAERWGAAWAALEEAGMPVALAGAALRVTGDGDPGRVNEVLRARGIAADVRVVPASFEEAFVAIAMGAAP